MDDNNKPRVTGIGRIFFFSIELWEPIDSAFTGMGLKTTKWLKKVNSELDRLRYKYFT